MINFPLLEKISKALTANDLEYIVIGGQAVLIYGAARFTDDIDILLNSDISKLDILNDLIKKSGLKKLQDDDFIRKTYVIPLLDEESKMRIDIIFSFTDFEKNAIARAETRTVNNVNVKFASIEDVIIMKLFAGRAIDMEDVKKLLRMNQDTDQNYILKWLKKFDEDPDLKLTEKFNDLI